MQKILFCLFALSIALPVQALSTKGRMGIGMSNQFQNGTTAMSIKIKKNDMFALGALFGMSLSDQENTYAAGVKFYRIIFDEPNLDFYTSGLAAILESENAVHKGFQFDWTFGSEFHIPGVESVGLSFEFGFSMNKFNDEFTIETAGYHFVSSGIHFYL